MIMILIKKARRFLITLRKQLILLSFSYFTRFFFIQKNITFANNNYCDFLFLTEFLRVFVLRNFFLGKTNEIVLRRTI